MARKKTRPTSGGDCFEASGKFLMDVCRGKPNCKLTLVHGEVAGQGSLEGITYGHAWVLDGDTVIDRSNGRNLRIPKMFYYAVGGINRINNTHEYTWDQVRALILKHEHWGPWDLKTRSGL